MSDIIAPFFKLSYHPVDDEDKLGGARASPFVHSLALRLPLYQDDTHTSTGRGRVLSNFYSNRVTFRQKLEVMTTLPNAGTDFLLMQYKFICYNLACTYWLLLERNMHFRVDVTLYMLL